MKKNWIAVALSGLLVAGCFPGEVVFASDMVKAGTEKTMTLEVAPGSWGGDLTNVSMVDKDGNYWFYTKGKLKKSVPNVVFTNAWYASGSTVAVQKDGTLWHYGEFGENPVKSLDGVSVVEENTVLKKDGTVWFYETWDAKIPTKILDDAVAINGNSALKKDKTLWTWNSDRNGKVVVKKALDNVMSFSSSGEWLRLAIKEDGTLWSWGEMTEYDKDSNRLGDGTTVTRTTPKKIMDNVATASANYNGGIALKKDGSLWAWGDIKRQDTKYELSGSAALVKVMDKVKYATVKGGTPLAIKDDNTLWAFGWGAVELTGTKVLPVKLMDNVAYAEATETFGMVMKTDGTVWGWNLKGEETMSPVPVQIMKNAKVLKMPEAPKAATKPAAKK